MTGHNTSERGLGTQGQATATTWVHKAEGLTSGRLSLSHGEWQVDFLHLVRVGAYCLSAVYKPCSSAVLGRSSLVLLLGPLAILRETKVPPE